jgi:hypothetical protein
LHARAASVVGGERQGIPKAIASGSGERRVDVTGYYARSAGRPVRLSARHPPFGDAAWSIPSAREGVGRSGAPCGAAGGWERAVDAEGATPHWDGRKALAVAVVTRPVILWRPGAAAPRSAERRDGERKQQRARPSHGFRSETGYLKRARSASKACEALTRPGAPGGRPDGRCGSLATLASSSWMTFACSALSNACSASSLDGAPGPASPAPPSSLRALASASKPCSCDLCVSHSRDDTARSATSAASTPSARDARSTPPRSARSFRTGQCALPTRLHSACPRHAESPVTPSRTGFVQGVLHTHPQSRIAEPLPHRWKPPDG